MFSKSGLPCVRHFVIRKNQWQPWKKFWPQILDKHGQVSRKSEIVFQGSQKMYVRVAISQKDSDRLFWKPWQIKTFMLGLTPMVATSLDNFVYPVNFSPALWKPTVTNYNQRHHWHCNLTSVDGYTTDDITYLWKHTDPVQIAKGLNLPRFSIEKYSNSYCNVKTNTGNNELMCTLWSVPRY